MVKADAARQITRPISCEATRSPRYKQLRRRGVQWEQAALFFALLLPLSVAAQATQDLSGVHIGAFDADAWNGIVLESEAY
jgi:hypothetical protein